MCDYRILLDIPYEIRKERVLARDGIIEEKFAEREKASVKYNYDDFDFIIKNQNVNQIRKMVKKA
jgi:dephospho-CoA kinase